MMRRGGPWGGGADPDLTRRPGSDPRTLRRIIGFFDPYRGRLAVIAISILASGERVSQQPGSSRVAAPIRSRPSSSASST